ncbi:11580_t:CDS:2 [Rhizophagus irregularis]|uniref:Uncharacterized protein n=1 Tax=Rhizophagus irregularis (strain DAOM 181602 / DAOM 197198 / MUCL 43194) TaxID=747089 RepID=U9ST55_RHIID|nr:11580_t:CDS:2 [Rhizophagus irregularis]
MSEPDIMVETYGTCKYQDSTETVEFNKNDAPYMTPFLQSIPEPNNNQNKSILNSDADPI